MTIRIGRFWWDWKHERWHKQGWYARPILQRGKSL